MFYVDRIEQWHMDIGYWTLDMNACVCLLACLCALEYIVQFTTKYWHQQFQQALNNNGHWFYAFFSLFQSLFLVFTKISKWFLLLFYYYHYHHLVLQLCMLNALGIWQKKLWYGDTKTSIKTECERPLGIKIDKFSHKICQTQTIPYH